MKARNILLSLTIFSLIFFAVCGLARKRQQLISPQQTFTVAGQARTALVYKNSVAAPAAGAPLIIAFHGHGGRAEFGARKFCFQELWPEAVVAYPQGLTGVQGITDAAGEKSGWQKNPGEQDDRDVKFFDVLLEQMQKQFKIDPKRIYVMGHSNGARFVNVLWKMRGEKIAALVSAAAQGGLMIRDAAPRPIFALIGEADPLVPARGQLMSIDVVRKVLQTDASKAKTEGYTKSEQGINGTELVTYIHPGGHMIPDEAYPLFVKFFQRHTLK